MGWLSVNAWLISALAIGYLALLFVVAFYGQKMTDKDWQKRPWLYSLALGASCTSWAFYGMVGQVAESGAILAPVYVGTILLFVLMWPILLKIIRIAKQQNLTSIADFIACRYDRSTKLAALVTLLALIATIPYIALQLRAISTSFDLLTGSYRTGLSTTFVVTIVLILFSVLVGTRQIEISKQNNGLMLAVAFASIIKLVALSAVGIFVTFYLYDGFGALLSQREHVIPTSQSGLNYLVFAQAILGILMILVSPQQFHLMVIENHSENELKKARWQYPLYLIAMNIFVLPIAIAGLLTFVGGSVDADTFVLSLPLFYQQAWLAVIVFIGGLAAATSMVIVATIVLSSMLTTEVITPALLKINSSAGNKTDHYSTFLLYLRRITIAVILLLAFIFELLIGQKSHLAAIGLLSFVLLAQFAPAVLAALFWRKATTKGAYTGIIVGSVVWFYTLLLPAIMPSLPWLETGPFNIAWLKPTELFGTATLDITSHGLFWSLAANLSCFLIISAFTQRSIGEKLQAQVFIDKEAHTQTAHLSIADLYKLLYRFTNKQTAEQFLLVSNSHEKDKTVANEQQLIMCENLLSGVLGSASTRMVINAASARQQVQLEDVASIVDEASQVLQFNRELLQAGVENIEQGISVVDADMNLVAWNKRYIELLEYPGELVQAGVPIAKLLAYNVERGIIQGDNTQALIDKRIAHMQSGHSHHLQRKLPNGLVIEIRGQAMPGGGFVSTFTDITAHIEAEQALQLANENLEKRVQLRTQELQTAKAQAEAANKSKTRFLAAASHDLMQPFNALALFTDMLKQKATDKSLSQLADNIENSLHVVEDLLSDLVEISRLDSNSDKIKTHAFALADILQPLTKEFEALSTKYNVSFNSVNSSKWTDTDPRLLRRVIQNFLSNAFHYCEQGKVVLGVRHQADKLCIEVWDNGPGIADDKINAIFKEFERLEHTREIPGLGLGLAISERIAKLLKLKINVRSTVGQGTCFSISVPMIQPVKQPIQQAEKLDADKSAELSSKHILLIDNDELMLTALSQQLRDWGCEVVAIKTREAALTYAQTATQQPDLIIGDYHLDNDDNGVDLVSELLATYQWLSPCVICSADPSEAVRSHTSGAQFQFARKPLKAIALKRILKQLAR
ncbi:PAS domain-containing hybrid sensor histidine kinase/response regulator [Thalassotalea agarivorans]|uniref:histidine kinase n=1 Tax=Thalassotalea agarivorans TaxID=349064 RepID=A0A1I0CPS1_THASX|nr:PAS-domain containing protein [Thalassotalea agarivorans]SET21279.1 multi-sensor hybrid histidine kinase [Thalassotalea agarivorans]